MLSYIVNFWALFVADSTILDSFLAISCVTICVIIVRFLFSKKVVFDS